MNLIEYRYEGSGFEVYASSVEDALLQFNAELQKRAELAGVSIGSIKIDGVRGANDQAKIRAIQTQFMGLVERLTIPSQELPEQTSDQGS